MQEKPTYDELKKRVQELEGAAHDLKQAKKQSSPKEMEDSLHLTQFCFDSAAIGIYHIQSDGRVLNVNAHAAKMLGYTIEELSGMFVWDFDPTINIDAFANGWRKLVADRVRTFESTNIRKDGSRIHVELTTNLLEYDGRQFFITFVQDITQRKQTEKNLKIARFSIDNANVGIYRIASNGKILEVNQEAARLLGYAKEELEDMSINDIDPLITCDIWVQVWQELSQGGAYAHERMHKKKDGNLIPVEIYTNLLEYDGQQYSISFVQDITDRKYAEKALKENERLLNNILESMGEGIFVLDSDFKCTIFNTSLSRMADVPKETVIGKIPWEALPALKDTPAEENIKKTMRGEPLECYELQLPLPEGKPTWFRDSFSPLKDDNGKVIGMVGVVTDITQRKQDEIEREKVLKDLQEALENVKALSGLLPICSYCKKIRDDKGYWNQLESYLDAHSDAEFSHGICPDCLKKLKSGLKPPAIDPL